MDITRQSLFANILYVILLSAIFWSGWLLLPELNSRQEIAELQTWSTLGKYIDSKFISIPILGIILSSLLVFINSLFVVRICVKNVIFLERSYMPALVYVIMSAGYFNSYLSFRPLIVATLVLSALSNIFRSYNTKSLISGTYLKTGLLFGLGAVVYEPAVMMLPLLIIALMTFRLFDVREWFAALVGYTLPLFFAAYTDWLMGNGFTEYFVNFYNTITSPNSMAPQLAKINFVEWGFIATIVLLFFMSIIKFIRNRKHLVSKVKPLKAYMFFVAMLILVSAALLFAPCRSFYFLPILAIPMAVIIPSYFNATKPGFLANFLYTLFIGGSIALYVAPLLRHLF